MRSSWKFHLSRLTIGLLFTLIAGWWSGHLLAVPATALCAYFVWQFYNVMRLHQWLQAWEEEPPESLGMWSDIFDRIKKLQTRNKKQYQRYQLIIDDFQNMTDAFPDATLVLDSNDLIIWFNDSAVSLLKLRIPDDQGQTVTNLLREPAFADWLAVQDKIQSHLHMPCPVDDNIMLQVSAVRIGDDQRLLIIKDITDIENLERVRRDLVANISHELRTPLTVLLGYLEMLQGKTGKPDPQVIQRMFEQAQQMHALLEDLLELSRIQATDNQDGNVVVDIPAMLAQLSEQAEELSQGSHKLVFNIQANLNLHGIAADLSSAFQNLIINAINFTPQKGSIEVQWKELDESLVLSVKDNGVGIPHRDIPRLTERFYRVGSDRARQSGGTGLGLAIVKHVLKNHQARLEIFSELGEGSEFRCVFPASRKA